MPKGRKKTKNYDRKRYEPASCSDYESGNESGSIVSSVSDIRSLCEDTGSPAEPEDVETTDQEVLIDKLKEAIDGATQKSSKGRQTCLESIHKVLAGKYLPEVIDTQRETMTEFIKSSLKRGKTDEQSTAAILAVLTCIQLGPGGSSDSMFAELCPVLTTTLNDNSLSFKTRAKCATALSMLAFIVGELEKDTISSLMSTLEAHFSASYLKGNGTVPNHTLEVTSLHASALSAWSLLLTILSVNEVSSMAERHIHRLSELLESADVELRIVAGETIALLYEVAREYDDNFMGRDFNDMCAKLKQLATDSHKYRAKKERKQQRSSFRDILRTVEENELPFIQVRFGNEVLQLDSWCRKRQYEAFCGVLGSGMNLHLSENELLRDIFELGAPKPLTGAAQLNSTKFERHMGNVAAFKKRTLARLKLRDKRAVIMT